MVNITAYKKIGDRVYEIHLSEDIETLSTYDLIEKSSPKLCVLETVKKYSQDELLSIRAKKNDEEFIKRYPNGRYTIDMYRPYDSFTLARTMNRQNCRVIIRRQGAFSVHYHHEDYTGKGKVMISISNHEHNAGLHSFDNMADMIKQAKRSRVPKKLIEAFIKEHKKREMVKTI